MSITEFAHYSLFPGLFVAFTYNKKQPPAFGAALSFFCILIPFLGLSFCHIPNNLSNYNVLTANAPFFYQISGTWSNHEGSILSWCWIPSFYGFLLSYRAKSHNVSKLRGNRYTFLFSFVSNFLNNSILSLQLKSRAAAPQLYTPFVQRDSSLSSRRNRTEAIINVDPGLLNAPYYPQMSFAVLDAGRSLVCEKSEGSIFCCIWHEKPKIELSPSMNSGFPELLALLCFSPFLSASSDPFVRNVFVCTEPLAESNPVSQDPISAIHPPFIYAGDVASAIGFSFM
ncbi:unnamed protein product [Musa acuminata subsp. malaccensis]|nr:unnamed protein product [Musa acuminata subsp. malaccensis]